jgi:hypothetical protein
MLVVAAGLAQEFVDPFENIIGLLGDRAARFVLGHLPRQVDRIPMDHDLAHARTGVLAFDGHGFRASPGKWC